MIVLALLVIWCWGYALVSFFGKGFNLPLKVGISMLCGLGLNAATMFLYDLLHIPIVLFSVLGLAFGCVVASFFKNWEVYKSDWDNLRSIRIGISEINFTWLFFFGILLYLLYGIYQKDMYWPVMEYDSVTGYDFMAKMIAAEGKLKVRVFDYTTDASTVARFIYPPLVACSYAIPYLCGMALSKIISIVFFVALLLAFYGALRVYTTHTASMIVTVLMAVAPEMFSHAALALTNLPNAAYASLAMITFYIWTDKRTSEWFYLSAFTMAFNLFSRSDSIVFVMATLLVMTWMAIKEKKFADLIRYGAISLSLFVGWMCYLKWVIHSNSADFFEKSLFWDGEKLDKIINYILEFTVYETQFYGITFWMFLALLALNVRVWRVDMTKFLLISLVAWIAYTFLYYQMNYKVASLDLFMKASYKRGMFCFVPLAWYYVATNRASSWFFNKIDGWLYR